MSKIIKIDHSYELPSYFSNVTLSGAWSRLTNYLQENKTLLSKIVFYKEDNKIKIQSIDENNLIDIIREIDPFGYFKKNLIRTIKLNVEFDKETKSLKISNKNIEPNENLNIIEYSITFDNNIQNTVYFHESSILVNYENTLKESLKNPDYNLGILYFNKTDDDKVTLENVLFVFDKSNKLVFVNDINKDNKEFDLNMFILKYNNGNAIIESDFNYTYTNESGKTCVIKFSNFKLLKTNILILNNDKESILLFKNSMNNYLFNNYLMEQYQYSRDI